jgi:hypothetical protein
MWELVKTFAVGGLINVGFAENSDILLVISHQGRGIFDCLKGERVARDSADFFDFLDEQSGKAKGFDILDGQTIKTYGLFGGDQLLKNTTDGWKLWQTDEPPFENLKGMNIILSSNKNENMIVGNDEVCELRAYGFSPTEKTFILATSCDLTIYRRAND